MKTLRYILRNMARNKIRTLLTILSVGFSLALMTVLYGFRASSETWRNDASLANRIVIMNIQGFSGELPIANVDKVRGMDDVVSAVPYSWFGGKYRDRENEFAQFGTDPDNVFKVWPEFTISPEQLKAWQTNRQGCVCDRRLAEKFDWKPGDRIPLEGTYMPVTLDLELVGTFDSPKNTGTLWFDWEYVDESLKAMNAPRTGNAGIIFALVNSRHATSTVMKTVDDQFASSPNPTRTQTEGEFAQMFADMLGNVQRLILVIGVAVVFSLSLVAATSMSMSMRERVTEIAVLKAIGFPSGRILTMVLSEACLIAMLGGVLGTVLGVQFLWAMHLMVPQFFPFLPWELSGPWLSYGLLMAAALGLISGLFPARRAAALSVVDGLRRIA